MRRLSARKEELYSMAGKNGRPAEDNRKVRCVETGEIYDNYREAAVAVGVDASTMYQCVSPRYGRSRCNKQHFEYISENE